MTQDDRVDGGGPATRSSAPGDSTPSAGRSGRSNARTALVLLSIALVFFIGVIVNRLLYN
jgi:hypothetical protein